MARESQTETYAALRLAIDNWRRSGVPAAQRSEAVESEQLNRDVEFADEGGERPTPYEVLLHAAMIGDSRRFIRQGGVEQCWRVMQPLLGDPPPVHEYAKESWARAEADKLLAGHGCRHGQWVES